MRPWRALGTVRRADFEGPDYQFVSAPFSGDAPVLEGSVREAQLQPGLWMHCAEVVDLHSMASRIRIEAGLRLRDHERMLRLRSFLDAEIHQPYELPLTIEELGRRFGLSVSALQRQFRQAFSSSVNEYRRSMRLQRARADLERGCTIAEAACQAGYTSAANFSTAFRRQFGVSPRDLCCRA